MAEELGQVGAFLDEANALRLTRQLRAEGKVVSVETKLLGGRRYYLVIVKGHVWPKPAFAYPLERDIITKPAAKPAEPSFLRPAGKVEEPQLRRQIGLGLYGDGLNFSGGGTIILNPHENIGLQALAGTGRVNFVEGRVVGRVQALPWLWPYLGGGYIHVESDGKSQDRDVKYDDSSYSVVGGLEMRLSRRASLFLEARGSDIELVNDNVYNPASQEEPRTSQWYSKASVGLGLVIYLY